MADLTPVLVLTRPEAQSHSFLKDVRHALGRELDVVISPVMRIEPVSFSLELSDFRTIIITSQNALSMVQNRLTGLTVRTVGAGTAEAANTLGAHAICLGESVEGFLARADQVQGPAVHLHGRHTQGNLVHRLQEKGIIAEGCVVYDQVEQPLTGDARKALARGSTITPVFSPRTAALVATYPIHENVAVLAISDAAANAWTAPGRISVAEFPDKESMIRLTCSVLSSDRLVASPSRR